MAVQRPLKEGSVRTYQEKVGLGFIDILASEMDADLDTIYAAWNGGVSTANLADLAVNTAKLADGAVTTPKLWDGAVTLPKLAPEVQGPVQGTFPGNVTAAGFAVGRVYAGSVFGATSSIPSAAYGPLLLQSLGTDSGGVALPASSMLVMPAWPSWCALSAKGYLDGNGAGGVVLAIELFTTVWSAIFWQHIVSPVVHWSFGGVMPTGASIGIRLSVNNLSGATRSVPFAELAGCSVGKT